MSLACSSVLRGGGTNQELVLHSLHECGGDVLVSTGPLGAANLQFAGLFKQEPSSVRPLTDFISINPSNMK